MWKAYHNEFNPRKPTLNYYSISSQIHRFLVAPRNLSISDNVMDK
jgi:hypothetical protein